MTVDISQAAYERYLDQYATYQKQWPSLAGQPKPYEEWAEAMQHRDHPRWVEYMALRRQWKASVFHVIYGPSAGTNPFPTFPDFPEWLEQQNNG